MSGQIISFASPLQSGMNNQSDTRPAYRLSIRSLLVLQALAAMIMLVFVGHWGWGTFLVALLATCGSAFAALRSRGGRRGVGSLAAASLAVILYVLSVGPCQGVGRVFSVATRTQIHLAAGWLFQPLRQIDWPHQTASCRCGASTVSSHLCFAYQRYLQSFR
jgi:hypothetical protein